MRREDNERIGSRARTFHWTKVSLIPSYWSRRRGPCRSRGVRRARDVGRSSDDTPGRRPGLVRPPPPLRQRARQERQLRPAEGDGAKPIPKDDGRPGVGRGNLRRLLQVDGSDRRARTSGDAPPCADTLDGSENPALAAARIIAGSGEGRTPRSLQGETGRRCARRRARIRFGPDGSGEVREPRLYQLIRQGTRVDDRRFEIEFLDPGVRAFVFTFG